MNQALIDALVAHNAFANDTIVTANYETVDLFGRAFSKVGDFRINRILKSNEKVQFELLSLQDTSDIPIKASINQIKAVDGMDI